MDTDSDPDPAIFVIDLQDANKKLIKESRFFLLCCILIEGFESGSIHLTNRSGSKNMWIPWIRIRNTGRKESDRELDPDQDPAPDPDSLVRSTNPGTDPHQNVIGSPTLLLVLDCSCLLGHGGPCPDCDGERAKQRGDGLAVCGGPAQVQAGPRSRGGSPICFPRDSRFLLHP
jgi:hypothetical protein